jgi:hypothetical protein
VKTLRIGDARKAVSAFDKKLGLKKEGAGKCSRPFFIGWQEKNGGDEGDRTPNLRIANAALSQLSYIPTFCPTI